MRNRLILVGLGVVCVLVSSSRALSRVRTLTIEDRIEAQRAIEEVYWSHRTWPEANRAPKPPLSAVMTEEALRSRVEDYLRRSNALAAVWGRPITSQQLQAEMERMARDTKAPDVLSELFAALDNDPVLIAETLVRQKLVERRLRDAYAYDDRFHGNVKRSAERALSRAKSVADLKALGGEYRETTWRLADQAESPVEREALGDDMRTTIKLDREKWDQHLRDLAGKLDTPSTMRGWTRLEEATDSFVVTAILSAGADEVTTATVTWRKASFDAWWSMERNRYGTSLAQGLGKHEAVRPHGSGCVDDTWRKTFDANVLNAAARHTAVWTGTEMIVWGGHGLEYLNTGSRYDPSTDTWAATSTGTGVPSGRESHTAVWTGTEMIVWGGYDGFSYLNTGGRYDPSTDTWAATSTGEGVPSGRYIHTAVWTGTEMIVWGGYDGFSYLNTGGRYDPSTDTWAATSTGEGVPSGRYIHTAVWTGTEMIVWGGSGDGGVLNTGGRYDPSTDAWAATSTGAGVPSGRDSHTAVWTGTEMIVWGGYDGLSYPNTGGRYDPSTETWAATSTGAGVTSGRYAHTAVWTGTEMIVWGGYDGSFYVNDGGRYDPSTDTWAATSTGAGVPLGRVDHTAVWTGAEMIVWGGGGPGIYANTVLNTGGRYDPSTDTWVATSTGAGVPSARYSHTAVWTGAEMIVWGGYDGGSSLLYTGGRYDPSTDTWAATSTGAGVPLARYHHTAVWTGRELIVWGGYGFEYLNTGSRYDPSTDTWTVTSTGAGVPSGRYFHTAVWTGAEMIVWGGYDGFLHVNNGGRYDPSKDTWAATSTGAGVPSGRVDHTAVWTGTEMIVWGGGRFFSPDVLNTGGRYDPSTDAWAATSTGAGVPSGRDSHAAVWTGTEMIVWGGSGDGGVLNTGGRYEPSTDAWAATSTGAGVPSGRYLHTAVWTGTEMIVWGGNVNTGGRYDPSRDTWTVTTTGAGVPSGRSGHTAVWTGTEMIVWGGSPLTLSGGLYCASASAGCSGSPSVCDDGDECTLDACDAGTGLCVNTPLACNDGNACNGVETCDSDSGCVAGTPVVCASPDQCLVAGVCDTGTGTCSYGNQPNGTTCDDGQSTTSPDTCQDGVCVGEAVCTSTNNPQTTSDWKYICRHGSRDGLQITDADAVCVGQLTDTFAGFTSRNQVCNVLDGNRGHNHDSGGSSCSKAEDELIALALNICKARVCPDDGIDSRCDGESSTVGASLATADGILSDPSRTSSACRVAECLANEINNGHALEFDSLTVQRQADTNRLTWFAPLLDNGTATPQSYTIWRRPTSSLAPFIQIASTKKDTYLDTAIGTGSWEYDVTAAYRESPDE